MIYPLFTNDLRYGTDIKIGTKKYRGLACCAQVVYGGRLIKEAYSMDIGLGPIVTLFKAIYDAISGRVRLDASMGSYDDEDEIHIHNESDKAVLIRHWTLVWRRRVKWFPRKFEYDEEDIGFEGWEDWSFKIPGKDKVVKTIQPPYTFNWHPPHREGQQLYLELYIGKSPKKPLRLHLHDVYVHKPKDVNN